MKLKYLLVFNAIVAGVYGLALVLVPTATGELAGIPPDPIAKFVAQLLGAVLIGVSIITWMVRNAAPSDALRAIVLAYFISNSIGVVLVLMNQLAGVMNALGWLIVAVYLLLALGYGYFQFAKPSDS